MTDRSALRLVAFAAVVVIGALLLWELRHLLLMLFGALMVALVLNTMCRALEKLTGLGHTVVLLLVVCLLLAMVGSFGLLLGSQIAGQLSQLIGVLPELLNKLEQGLRLEGLEQWLAQQAKSAMGDGSLLSDLSGVSALVASSLVNVMLVFAGGIFIAARPEAYRHGLFMLVPPEGRAEAQEVIEASTTALRWWLLGQLVSMLIIGVLTTAGLIMLGIPSAFALGLLAGLLEFIPYVGPVLSGVPAVAVALGEGPMSAVWVTVLYVAIQQIEAALLVPVIQRRAVDLPPAVTIFSVLAFGIVFGPWGVVFGAPLTVLTFVLVKKLWVRDTLGEKTSLPGESD